MSAISILNFKDPISLANFLYNLSNNEIEYNKYLSHKLIDNYDIYNERLKKALKKNKEWLSNEFGNYVEEFECYVCKNIHIKKKTKIVDKKHYNCPLPKNPLTNKIDYSNSWTRQWILEKCSAKILNYYLQNNLTINMENFEKDKIKLYDRNEC